MSFTEAAGVYEEIRTIIELLHRVCLKFSSWSMAVSGFSVLPNWRARLYDHGPMPGALHD